MPRRARFQAARNKPAYRVLRGIEDPNEVIVQVEFPSLDTAEEGRNRLVESGVLERLLEVTGAILAEEADTVRL